MRTILRAVALTMFLIGSTPAHAIYDAPVWTNQYGTFQNSGGWQLQGGTQAISATWDPVSQILQMQSTSILYIEGKDYYRFSGLLSLSALVTPGTGELTGGSYSLLAGALGIPELGVAPGTTLLTGAVLDLDGRTYLDWLGRQRLVANYLYLLLNTTFVHPDLNLSSEFLTLNSRIVGVGTDWWVGPLNDFGNEEWDLMSTFAVPEPESLALLGLGLAGLGLSRRRKAS